MLLQSQTSQTLQPLIHQVDTVFHFKLICVIEVEASLTLLNTHKSIGADGISAHLLRTVVGAIAPSINKLFNLSLYSKDKSWKKTNVTPIPKTSNSKSPSNFRPISVLRVLSKVFESFSYPPPDLLLSNSTLSSTPLPVRIQTIPLHTGHAPKDC